MSPLVVQTISILQTFLKSAARNFQTVRMAKTGLAVAPTLALKVLINFGLGLVTSY